MALSITFWKVLSNCTVSIIFSIYAYIVLFYSTYSHVWKHYDDIFQKYLLLKRLSEDMHNFYYRQNIVILICMYTKSDLKVFRSALLYVKSTIVFIQNGILW